MLIENPKDIENVVVGTPLVAASYIFALDADDWIIQEKKTLFTDERFLPRILVQLGCFKSTSDVRRNRPELFINLTKNDYLEIKIGRRRLYIAVGSCSIE